MSDDRGLVERLRYGVRYMPKMAFEGSKEVDDFRALGDTITANEGDVHNANFSMFEAAAAIERLLAERDEAREALRQAQTALEPFWGAWTTHRGHHDPDIPGDALVTVLFRDNDQAIGRMHDWDQNWQWADDEIERPGHIIMYRTIVARQEATP